MEPNQEDMNKGTPAREESAGDAAASQSESRTAASHSYSVRRMAMRVVVVYLVVSALWILISDQVLVALVSDLKLLGKIAMVKGWAFVGVTAALLFFLLRRETRHWVAERQAREKAEAVTQESEQRFRQLFDLAPLPIAYFKMTGVAVSFNRRFTQELGYTHEDLPTLEHWLLRVHPDENERREAVARWDAAVQCALKNKTDIAPEEFNIRCKNGETRTYLISGSFLSDGILSTLVDISARKHTEEQLRFQEAILRETGEIAKVGGWQFNTATGVGRWTDQVARIHDLDPTDPISKDMGLSHYKGESRTRIEAAIKAAIEQGTVYDLVLELTTAKGRHKWVRAIGHPIVENGKIIRLHGSFQDITELRCAEDSLRESADRFRQMAENIDEIFWLTSVHDHRILYINPAYERIWGSSCESLYAKPETWADAIHPDDRARVLAAAEARKIGDGYTENYRILRPDKQVRWILVRVFPVHDSMGQSYRMVGIATDITERRKLEEQFRNAQKMEALGTLAGGIAHDFNNIIGAIMGYTELAKMDSPQPAVQSCHNEILSACGRAGDLVRQILAFSKQREQQRRPLQLWQTVAEATRLLRAVLPATVDFQIELDRASPTVLADPTQIHQVVMNLCTNAQHAMASKVGKLSVSVKTFQADEPFIKMHEGASPGRYACLTVSDSGHGMEQNVIDRIFEPFFTTKAPGVGTGLGLSVVHGIVQGHDGVITVESKLGEGTTFRVYFPENDKAADEEPTKIDWIAQGHGQRILVVDDEEALARMVGKALTKLGFKPETINDPVAALAKFRLAPENYDLIITDLTMPHMTGLEFAASALSAKPQIKTLLMTGFADNLTEKELAAAGIVEVLRKPITLNDLGRAIERILKQEPAATA
ncbi:MAG: PAS domain-containing protein [Verrucomicrobia bacterium]|nr:PAS domain-containing protein [Verrucomicrobiota bacterium]